MSDRNDGTRPTGRELLRLTALLAASLTFATACSWLVPHDHPGERRLVWWMFLATAFIAGGNHLDRP
ncbi:hypothetical protein ACWEQL_06040 [Kitasatospora sp. NPDC004240]